MKLTRSVQNSYRVLSSRVAHLDARNITYINAASMFKGSTDHLAALKGCRHAQCGNLVKVGLGMPGWSGILCNKADG